MRLFQTQFALNNRARESAAERIRQGILRALDKVASLDEDRILRSYLTVIRATLRTNYYQTSPEGSVKSWVSFKLDPHAIPDLPLPRPKFEIFVYSPRVEGVHLRMGYVARGGMRWSDRREDFRTEVLGLMKAQNVKNTVIVPVGAKGGFYPKRLPPSGSREDVQKEVIESYQTFIRGLLDLTDNIVNGKTVVRPGIVRRDGDDAYLVVAADKGTATFSDIANAISIEYGHWLGDAFRLGRLGGIRPQGHGHHRARRLGVREAPLPRDSAVDIQSQALHLRRHRRHVGRCVRQRHAAVAGTRGWWPPSITGTSSSTRIRMWPARSASANGCSSCRDRAGTTTRASSSRAAAAFGRVPRSRFRSAPRPGPCSVLDAAAATPVDVMRAILRMPVDLLWNGGIGTYVKSSDETHAEVRDRANDAIRADGREIRARVIGEGGNLGARSAAASNTPRSGGPQEVRRPRQHRLHRQLRRRQHFRRRGEHQDPAGRSRAPRKLTRAARNKLLASMTDEVAGLVLRNNYLQSQALSVLEQRAPERLTEYQSLIRALERGGT